MQCGCINENFTKIKFLNFFNLNLIKLHTQKKAILYGKINSNNVNYYGIIMMSKTKAPIHSYKNQAVHYQNGVMISKPSKSSKIFSFQHFSMTNEASYDDLERILGSPPKKIPVS